MPTLPAFDGGALIHALDAERDVRGLTWSNLADELWQQSADLNARLADNALCPGALVRTAKRETMSCQYALIRCAGSTARRRTFWWVRSSTSATPGCRRQGPASRLRWDLSEVHAAVNEHRNERRLTWAEVARELGCTPSRLTNLKTARLADMGLVMGITQRLVRPAAARFVHPTEW